ncbi:hypothetical protein [Actinomycetospora aeridis]|uniref:Lipoprotein n=1 Tax=Actinomycetospora aeridis TaxID=3129231 RepID=A0ABU8NBQ2_9PSEU
MVLRRAAALVVLLLTLGGCAALGETLALSGRLADDGFADPTVSASAGTGGDQVVVRSTGHARLAPDAAVGRAVEITWRTFPRRLDGITASVGGRSASATAAELTARLGPRDPALDAAGLGGDVRSGFRSAAIAVGVVGLVIAVVVTVIVVVLVRRSRRQRTAVGPPGPPGPPPWGPPGPPPAWGPPPGRPPRRGP